MRYVRNYKLQPHHPTSAPGGGWEDAYFQGTGRCEVWMVNDLCGFYACAIPTSPKHSWNVFSVHL